MSWKRILQTARRLGAPVIVADESAKEPLVILPLDVYEKMSGGGDKHSTGKPDFGDEAMDEDRMAKIFESAMESLVQEDLPVLSQKNQSSATEVAEDEASVTEVLDNEIPLEDKYYFEPLDDGPKK